MADALMPLIWVVAALLALLLLQRWIHAHLHGVSLLITGKPEYALVIYTVILFPGVLLHEVSHWLAATLLGVKTGHLSVMPKRQRDGTLQLGYVEYYKGSTLGPIRESLIGAAPLLAGTLVILLIGIRAFGVTDLAAAVRTGDIDILAAAMGDLFQSSFTILWVYLIFAVSNAMLPSKSDRRAWPAFFAILLGVLALLYLIGIQDRLAERVTGPAVTVLGYLGTAFSIAVAVDLLFVLAIALLESLFSRLRGMSVVYGDGPNEERTA